MNRISHNSEHDLVNVRLLSICPPDALRPYYQEGYLVATEDLKFEYDNKSDLDFNRRLIAKFRIPTDASFWGKGFSRIPKSALYPGKDRVGELCKMIRTDINRGLYADQLGEFMLLWNDAEEWILNKAREREPRMFSVNEAINRISDVSIIDENTSIRLHRLRKLRDQVVHHPNRVPQDHLREGIRDLTSLLNSKLRIETTIK